MNDLNLLFLVMCLFAGICGRMALTRNRNVVGWGVFGFLSGILPIIILAAVGPANGGPAMTGFSPLDEIKKLKALKDGGVLSEEEFSQQKRNLLAQAD